MCSAHFKVLIRLPSFKTKLVWCNCFQHLAIKLVLQVGDIVLMLTFYFLWFSLREILLKSLEVVLFKLSLECFFLCCLCDHLPACGCTFEEYICNPIPRSSEFVATTWMFSAMRVVCYAMRWCVMRWLQFEIMEMALYCGRKGIVLYMMKLAAQFLSRMGHSYA